MPQSSSIRAAAGKGVRHLVIVLGDQLDPNSAAFDGFDAALDVVWMAENEHEATHVWCHRQRLVLFFAAMRHFRDQLVADGLRVDYHGLEADRRQDSGPDFGAILRAAVRRLKPSRLVMVEPGDWRVWQALSEAAAALNLPLEIRADRHFYCGIDEFTAWAGERKRLVLEDFYRHMRRQHQILMDGDAPTGGAWNFDRDNRESFGRDGPEAIAAPLAFAPDAITQEVIALVAARYPDHPGDLEGFAQPVTPDQTHRALADFIDNRLPAFGRWQDALWTGAHFLHHSRLSAALNLHLLDPRACVDAAIAAWQDGAAPINAVEGFVRQILGWREYVRGLYWQQMPGYAECNELGADLPVPVSYWHGKTDMRCVREAMQNVLAHGYAHHIQRLMVLGLFAQLAGVQPKAFHDWHMAMYLDAIDWVSLPNALGMSQYGDGGIVGTKPYCASGNYINRMSNYCRNCSYNYKHAVDDDACPVTTLYWDFLDRHSARFQDNQRMFFQMRNLAKKQANSEEITAIRARAKRLRDAIRQGERL